MNKEFIRDNIIHKGTNKTIILNSCVLYLRLGFVLFVSLFSTRFVLEGLGETNFGIYNLIAGVVALFGFISATMAGITQRFLSYEIGATQDVEHVCFVFNTSLRLHLFVAIAVAIIVIGIGSCLIHTVLNIPERSIGQAHFVLICTSIGVLITIIGVPFEAILMAHENILFVAVVQVVSTSLKFLSAVLLLFLTNNQLIIYSILMALIPLLIVISQIYYTNKKYPEAKFNCISLKKNNIRREMQTFAGLTLWGNMGWAIRDQGISIFLNIFFGVLINAANGIANQVNGALLSLSSSLTTSIRPQLVQSAGEKNYMRMIALAFSACKFPLLIISMIGTPIMIAMPIVLKYWLKEVPDYSITFCRILICNLLLNQLTYGMTLILDAIGQVKRLHIWVGASLILTTILTFFVGKYTHSPIAIYGCIIGNAIIISLIRIILAYNEISILGYIPLFRTQFIKSIVFPVTFIVCLTIGLFIINSVLPTNLLGFIILMATSVTSVSIMTVLVFLDKEYVLKIKNKLICMK